MARGEEFTLDVEELVDAMQLYERATGKEMSDVINRKATRICFTAAKHTKKASLVDINKNKPRKRNAEYQHKLFHALASEGNTKFGKAVRGQGNTETALKIYNSRRGASGYSKAIWYSLARELGAKLRSKIRVDSVKATKAKPLNPTATIDTGSIDIELRDTVLVDALKVAIREEAADMQDYAQRKLDEQAAKFSAR